MIVLHAIWSHYRGGELSLWAESSYLPALVTRRAGRQAKTPQVRQHPFSLASQLLQEALHTLVGEQSVAQTTATSLVLRLPSSLWGPEASPELVREDEHVMHAEAFLPWEVSSLTLDPVSMLDFLHALPDRWPQGIVAGSSLRFWSLAADFAFELLARQCYMPALQPVQDAEMPTWSAGWQLALTSEDAERLAALARIMPAVCCSLLAPDGGRLSSRQETLQYFLQQIIDSFVHAALAQQTWQPPLGVNGEAFQVLPEQWLRGLLFGRTVLQASEPALKAFVETLQTWLAAVQPGEKNAAFRTCFRLDAPPEEIEGKPHQNWRVSFHLQANDDRSLLVPAEKVWQERSGTLKFLKRTFENPQERLLADLGRASRLFPIFEESLKTACPAELHLSTEQAYAFLREAAPLLEQSGFGVLVPPWWRKPASRLGVKLKIRPGASVATPSGLLGLEGIVAYDWTVSIGDTTLSDSEFRRLVNLKLPLIKVRGQWVELRPEEIERAIAFFQKKRRSGNMTLGEALHAGLAQEVKESGLPIVEIEGEGWMRDLLGPLADNMTVEAVAPPTTFHGQLRPYQLKGVSWLAFLTRFGLGACLADDMGLGKTIELITLLLQQREAGAMTASSAPVLLICPMSIVGNWQREIARFAPSLRVMIHHGHERLSGEAFLEEVRQCDVVITTYALALRDREHLTSLTWEYLVVDEAQNMKNEAAKQTRAIKSFSAHHRIALTGTPVENRLSELWSIMEFLNPGYLGSATDFRQRFALPIERYHDASRAEMLKRVIQPFVLRRLKTDKAIIADLPEKMEMKVLCNLTQEQASLYEAVVKEMLEKIEAADGIERKGLVLATLLKLKQICNHPAQFVADGSSLPGRSGKLARLEEMLEEVLAANDKALIFSQFAEMGTLLRRALQEKLGCEILFLHGGTPKRQRDAMIQRFQEERQQAPLFILSLKAGGVGLNLTAANHVFHFDRWWNPAVEDQATDRAFRIGQKRNVQVHKFVCVGTLEERIDLMIEQKKELAASIVGSGESWLTEMSTSTLKELFALSHEAIGE